MIYHPLGLQATPHEVRKNCVRTTFEVETINSLT